MTEKDVEQSLDAAQFERLEREFQEVLTTLLDEPTLDRFRVEYEKLHRALKKSHDNEKRLIKKVHELNTEIVSNAAKVQMALKISSEDQTTIAELRKQIDKAYALVKQSQEREARAKETIGQLKLEVAEYQKLLEEGPGASEEETVLSSLKGERDVLVAERDSQMQQLVNARQDLADSMERVRALEAQKAAVEMELKQVRDTIRVKEVEAEREQRAKERLENELREMKAALEDRVREVADLKEHIEALRERGNELNEQVHDQRQYVDKLQKEHDLMTQKQVKMQQELDEKNATTQNLNRANKQLAADLKMKEAEVEKLLAEQNRINKMRDALQQKIREVEQQKIEVEQQRDALRAEAASREREMDDMKRMVEVEKKKVDDLLRERDLLNKNLQKSMSATAKQADLVRFAEATQKTLDAEIGGYKGEAQDLRRQIFQLEKEREKYGMEASEATAKYLVTLQEVKAKQLAILDAQKKITDSEAKLKQQQTLYEAVRSDRNLYSKHLMEAKDEIAEMKRKFKIMNHQIDQLKEEIVSKDQALVKVHFEHEKVKKERETLKYEVGKLNQHIQEADGTLNSQRAEIQKLNQIIREADQERLRQKKDYDAVVNERDVLGTQLIRRNDELALLYEKIKIQESTLRNGEVQYRERMQDIRVLKLKIADLKRELQILRRSVSNIDALRNEVYHLQRELLQERTKVKALSEELANPMNVHRWRKLEGSDPTTFDLIQKVQTLQKRLIAKTEEVVDKELLIQEKEKLYVELKNILARQPGPEVAEQLNVYQQQLREKTKQLKAMASELNMYQANVNEFKFEIERLTRELQEVKKKYYEMKRRDQSRDRQLGAQTMIQAHPPPPRFTGGGFSLTQH